MDFICFLLYECLIAPFCGTSVPEPPEPPAVIPKDDRLINEDVMIHL